MSYQQQVFALIAKLGGSKDKAVVDPTLCRFMGGLQGGVFLSQLLYWCDKGRGGTFYKTYKEWEEEIFLSKYEVNKSAKQCIDMGFLKTEVRKANGNPTVHYTLLPDRFVDLILSFVQSEMESKKFDEPLENQNLHNGKSIDLPSITETTYTQTNAKKKMRPTRAQRRNYNDFPDDDDADRRKQYTLNPYDKK
jgi:hypothetical protein